MIGSLAAIIGGNWRYGSPVYKFRNFEEKNFWEGCLENHFCSRGWSPICSSLREFLISSDVKYGVHRALRSTIFSFWLKLYFKFGLDLSYYWDFAKLKIDIGLMVNKIVLRWDSLSQHCRKFSNRTCNYLIRGFSCAG